jgi:hypothetical protein
MGPFIDACACMNVTCHLFKRQTDDESDVSRHKSFIIRHTVKRDTCHTSPSSSCSNTGRSQSHASPEPCHTSHVTRHKSHFLYITVVFLSSGVTHPPCRRSICSARLTSFSIFIISQTQANTSKKLNNKFVSPIHKSQTCKPEPQTANFKPQTSNRKPYTIQP